MVGGQVFATTPSNFNFQVAADYAAKAQAVADRWNVPAILGKDQLAQMIGEGPVAVAGAAKELSGIRVSLGGTLSTADITTQMGGQGNSQGRGGRA